MTYAYPYNFSNGTSVEGLGSLLQYTNVIGLEFVGAAIVLLIWLVSFGAMIASGSKKALLGSSFISMIFAGLFTRLGMINPSIFFGLLVLTIVGLIGSKGEVGY